MKKNYFLLLIIHIVFLSLIIFINPVYSSNGAGDATGVGQGVSLTNPLGTKSIPELIGRIINGVLGIVGSIALVMFIYGGFNWMTAAGNMEKVQKGKDILIWAAIGLVIGRSLFKVMSGGR